MDSKYLVDKVLVQYENWKKNETEENGFKLIYEFNELAKTRDYQTIFEVHKQVQPVMVDLFQKMDMEKFRLWHTEQDKKRRNDI